MMGEQENSRDLFSYRINLDHRVRANHPLRRIAELIDFSFVREEVHHLYGSTGKPSVDPEVILKLMFLLFYDNHNSERQLMDQLPERLDYLWFLGYSLDDQTPNHSVLSKARKRWGPQVFEQFFTRSIAQACEQGLIDADKLFADSSLIDADASSERTAEIDPELWNHIKGAWREQEGKLEQVDESEESEPELPEKETPEDPQTSSDIDSGKHLSAEEQVTRPVKINTTDGDASLIRRAGLGKAKPRYKAHRMVDAASGVIVATEATAADIYDGDRLMALLGQTKNNIGDWMSRLIRTVVGDNHYATLENFRSLGRLGLQAHLGKREPSGAASAKESNAKGEAMLKLDEFTYDHEADVYHCPGGKELRPGRGYEKRKAIPYRSRRSECRDCPLLSRCTASKSMIRVVLRHQNQELIDEMLERAQSPTSKRDLRQRMGMGEGSFGIGSRQHGMKRARYRGLWKVGIENHLIAAIQNIGKIVSYRPTKTPGPAKAQVIAITQAAGSIRKSTSEQAKAAASSQISQWRHRWQTIADIVAGRIFWKTTS